MSHRTKRLSRLGNSVVPQCAQYVAERIIAADSEELMTIERAVTSEPQGPLKKSEPFYRSEP